MIRNGYYALYHGIEYHWTKNMNTGKMKIFTHDNEKANATFIKCNDHDKSECYEKYIQLCELTDVYRVDTYAVGNEKKEMLVLRDSGNQFLVSVGNSNMDLIEHYQLKEVDRGIFHGWVNKENVQIIEKRKSLKII